MLYMYYIYIYILCIYTHNQKDIYYESVLLMLSGIAYE